MQRLPPSISFEDHQPGLQGSSTTTTSSSIKPLEGPENSKTRPTALRVRKEKRFQVSRACARCKRLQKGCSQGRPCQRCVAVGLGDQCTETPVTPVTADSTGSGRVGVAPPRPQPHADLYLVFGRRVDLLMDQLLPHCLDRFLSRMLPTLPILTPPYVERLRSSAFQLAETPTAVDAYGLLHAICAMVILQVDRDTTLPVSLPQDTSPAAHGNLLLAEALRVHHHASLSPTTPTLERVLLAFFIYACHSAQSHHSQAFLFLREATTLYLLLCSSCNSGSSDHSSNSSSSSNNGNAVNLCSSPTYTAATAGIQDRLFWLLLVSERSHAIRYRRPITLYITQSSPPLQLSFFRQYSDASRSFTGFRSLAALFAPLGTNFIATLLHEEPPPEAAPPGHPDPLAAMLTGIEDRLGKAVPAELRELDVTERANLVATQLWLRIVVWQLRLRLGLLTDVAAEAPARPSQTYRYPLDAVRGARAALDGLPAASLAVHGVGMTEKLYDVACSVVDVLALPLVSAAPKPDLAVHEDDLRFLAGLIAELPGGQAVYYGLLTSHMDTALPGFYFC